MSIGGAEVTVGKLLKVTRMHSGAQMPSLGCDTPCGGEWGKLVRMKTGLPWVTPKCHGFSTSHFILYLKSCFQC